MPFVRGRDTRTSLRIRDYDYSTPGAYFVTICAEGRSCRFGEIVESESVLNDAGRMVAQWWNHLPDRFPNATADTHVVMPNHFHGILILHHSPVGAGPRACPDRTTDAPSSGARLARPGTGTHVGVPLPDVIGWFKTMTTNAYIRGVRDQGWARFEGRLWQRNYFEHILRNDERLAAARRYIAENPAKWAQDPERPR